MIEKLIYSAMCGDIQISAEVKKGDIEITKQKILSIIKESFIGNFYNFSQCVPINDGSLQSLEFFISYREKDDTFQQLKDFFFQKGGLSIENSKDVYRGSPSDDIFRRSPSDLD